MPNFKKFIGQWFLIFILLTVFSILSLDATDEKNKYSVCIVNDTNQKIFYKAGWCTGDGRNWTGWVNFTIPADYVYSHWSEELDRMDIGFHTGGKYGRWIEYTIHASKGGCQDSSTAIIDWNERGYLRLFEK